MGAEVQEEKSSGVGVEVQKENGVSLVGGAKEVDANPQRWQADESTVLTLPAVTKRYKLRVRQASCYCSKCSVGAYDDCVPAKKYAGMVGMVKAVSGKHKVTRASCGVGN
ncbi:unnamed protein product [Ectocarpus sp. 12 AP-2014]